MQAVHPLLATATSFEAFRTAALAAGFDEATERTWLPGQVIDDHTHPFDAQALVVAGEMWLSDASGTQHLWPGGTFALPRGTPHAERYGAAGATYWVARRAR